VRKEGGVWPQKILDPKKEKNSVCQFLKDMPHQRCR
jgi:hypothetical protein